MILDLTIENLLKSGCNEAEANEIFNSTGGDYRWPDITCFVSRLENKFYTGIDFYRKVNFNNGCLGFPINCPDLIPEYFDLALTEFLKKQSELLGVMYNNEKQTKNFILLEIERSKFIIIDANKPPLKRTIISFEKQRVIKNVYEAYIDFLEAKDTLTIVLNNSSVTDKYLIQGTNKNGTVFFEYLIENYRQNETSKVKFVNILHFLKNDANKKYFTFKVRQKDYNNIVSKYDIKILKFSKSELYLEDERPILHSLETAFLKTLTP